MNEQPQPHGQPHAQPGSAKPPAPADEGSVLLLVPAGVLVLFVLAAIAVDSALAFLGQRELSAAAAAAANDAAGAAVSDAAFYGGSSGDIAVDGARAQRVAADAVIRRRPTGVTITHVVVRTDGPHVCVAVTGRVPYLFTPIVPGLPRGAEVRGESVATAVVGGGRTAPSVSDSVCGTR